MTTATSADPQELVLNYVRQHGSIRRSEVVDLCRLTAPQARVLLKRMKAAGQLQLERAGRGSIYRLKPGA